MGIEKMTYLDISGSTKHLDAVLTICMRSGMFQPEYATKLSEYSVGDAVLLRNPYSSLRIKSEEIYTQLSLNYTPASSCDSSFPPEDTAGYVAKTEKFLDYLRTDYPAKLQQQIGLRKNIEIYKSGIGVLESTQNNALGDLTDIASPFVFLGRMSSISFSDIENMHSNRYKIDILDKASGYVWLALVTDEENKNDILTMFDDHMFQYYKLPDFNFHNYSNTYDYFSSELKAKLSKMELGLSELEEKTNNDQNTFADTYTRIKFLHDTYDLRKYVVNIRDSFHLIGYVERKNQTDFVTMFKGLPEVKVLKEPAGRDSRIPVPVKLKNNWFTRPFEMFVNMYGSPSYKDIDPTPFVAYTYTLLFGIMFGDLGQGIVVSLIGYILWKMKKMELGRVMTRIGFSSAFFGFCYGSVFGFEHLLDPVFRAIGFASKPIEIMESSTTTIVLIAAIGLGTVLIVSAILFNILVAVRKKNYDRLLLSNNGVPGLIFYVSILIGVVFKLMGKNIFTTPYILLLIVLPIAVMFFREPIANFAKLKARGAELNHHADDELRKPLEEHLNTNISALFESEFISARFGRIPIDGYNKLDFYENEPFMIYPLKTDIEYIWIVYASAMANKGEIDAIFHDLYFEPVTIPEEDLATPPKTSAFIRNVIDRGLSSDTSALSQELQSMANTPKTTFQKIFPEGIGGFLSQNIFEMFEVMLSFVTNTMSFLRVGGFALVHAGMMSVVFTLAGMMGSFGSVAVIIIGNIFVMCLEGLIVGIQTLRLEFYEMFSRFYDADGEQFAPLEFQCIPSDNNV